MKVWLKKMLRQAAVYWGTPSENSDGTFSYADPVQCRCQWGSPKEDLIIDAEGRERVAHASVFLNLTPELNGFLYLGLLDDLDSDADMPEENPAAYKIIAIEKVVNHLGKDLIWKATV
jgi:hypothetical protein